MRVLVLPADLGGCGHYRMRWPAEALQAQGADIRVALPGDPADEQLQAAFVDDAHGVPQVVDVVDPDADVVVLQRPLARAVADAIPWLQRKGIRVVVEIDDDFEAVSRRNDSWKALQPHLQPDRNKDHLRRACDVADWVVTSTSALARRYGRHGRVTVVPNHVPERYLAFERDPHPGVFVGWTGSVGTHPDDLQVTQGYVAAAIRKTPGAAMAVVGTGRWVQRNLGLDAAPLACGWRDLDDYPEAVAQFDVGIVPLEQSAFNHAKSWLKGLEMAALGVAFAATPTPEYVALNRRGAGFLADKPRSWERHLLHLLRNVDARADQADRGRAVARALTIEGNCGRWWDAWTAPVNTPVAA